MRKFAIISFAVAFMAGGVLAQSPGPKKNTSGLMTINYRRKK